MVRGQDEEMGTPFIDEYIAATEPVVDYLTEYSGIEPGDLDPTISPYYVTPLKVISFLIQSHCITKTRILIIVCIQEIESLIGSWLRLYWPWFEERFPYYKYVRHEDPWYFITYHAH